MTPSAHFNNVHHNRASSSSVQQRFFKKREGWYVSIDDSKIAGPYADKADAQMALMYYNVRTLWPSAKQLREFVRQGF